jgi:hypothetical protein
MTISLTGVEKNVSAVGLADSPWSMVHDAKKSGIRNEGTTQPQPSESAFSLSFWKNLFGGK